jgi:hypothetical protein
MLGMYGTVLASHATDVHNKKTGTIAERTAGSSVAGRVNSHEIPTTGSSKYFTFFHWQELSHPGPEVVDDMVMPGP